MGDLNCRTGNLPDFQVFENNVHVFDEYENVFDTFNLPEVSSDRHVTSLGKRILSFCQLYAIHILNGRLGKDKDKGHYTYISPNRCSVIDYVLASKQLFDNISNFIVETRTESTHMPIKGQFKNTICICLSNASSISCNDSSNVTRFSNSKKNISVFKNNMKSTFTQYIINLMTNINDMATDINSVVSDLINVNKSCAVEQVPCNRNYSQQAWFRKKCENL